MSDNIAVSDDNRYWYSHPGVAGRKPKASTLVKRSLALLDRKLPQIFEAIIQKAIDGDREAQIYCIDRAIGKPQQSADINLQGGEALTASLVANLFQMLAAKKKEMELENRQAIQIEKTGTEEADA